MGASESVPQKSFYKFTVKGFRLEHDSKGNDVNLSIYKGKVLLIVNVASKCGFTDTNYSQLTDLYNKYKDKGLEILAFPCNQFLKQEPQTSQQEAQQFAYTRYKAEYPIFRKGTLENMSNLTILQFPALEVSGSNYLSWALDGKVHLQTMGIENTIKQENHASQQDKAKAMIFLRHHLHGSLKPQYLIVDDPLTLWDNIKERYDQNDIFLPEAQHEWMN